MGDIRLVSRHKCELKPLVEGTLANELRLLEGGMRQAEQRLQEFQKKYQMITREFVSRFENDEMEETMDFAEWIGEFRLLERLRDKAETLRDIRFAN